VQCRPELINLVLPDLEDVLGAMASIKFNSNVSDQGKLMPHPNLRQRLSRLQRMGNVCHEATRNNGARFPPRVDLGQPNGTLVKVGIYPSNTSVIPRVSIATVNGESSMDGVYNDLDRDTICCILLMEYT